VYCCQFWWSEQNMPHICSEVLDLNSHLKPFSWLSFGNWTNSYIFFLIPLGNDRCLMSETSLVYFSFLYLSDYLFQCRLFIAHILFCLYSRFHNITGCCHLSITLMSMTMYCMQNSLPIARRTNGNDVEMGLGLNRT